MKTIWKYRVAEVYNNLEVPEAAVPLTVQMQDDEPQMWLLVDPEAPKEKRRFNIYGTGWEMPNWPGNYVGTWQDGSFVFHVFDMGAV